jgi:Arc/MetJ-type ribon-helix-helix transcriptional regulator
MGKLSTISAKIPDDVYREFRLRVSEGNRSAFIRDAILEKLEKTPRPEKLMEVEDRLRRVEAGLAEIKKSLAKLEVLTFDHDQINLYAFCIDTLDQKIIDYLLHSNGATTSELAGKLKTNRWLVLNRLRRIQKTSAEQLGKAVVQYNSGIKRGKKRAWWLIDEIAESQRSPSDEEGP